MFKELLISFGVCLVAGAIINGLPVSTPAPTPTSSVTGDTSGTSNASSSATGTSTACTSCGEGVSAAAAQAGSKAVDATDDSFDKDVLKSELPVLVDFSSTACAPCVAMGPIIDQLSKDYDGRVKVVRVDIDQNVALKDKYEIQMLPTFVMFQSGQKVAKYSGQLPQEMLAGVLDKQLGVQ